MNKKRLIITSVISIILVSILMIGSTYSIFTTSDIDEDLNVYTTGNLDITYTLSEDNVTLDNFVPTSMEDANTVIPYRITVTNNGTVPYMFDLSLEDTTASNQIDSQYIMIKVGYLDSKSLSECTNNIIKEDIILPAGESVDIDVRVWISDTITNTELGKSFFAKLTVDGIAIYDKNETIDNSILSLRYMKTLFTSSTDYSYFKVDDYREKIKNVSFVDYIDTTNPVESWDVSEKGDHSIVAWVTNNETEGYYDLYIGSNQFIYSKDLSDFFSYMSAIENISFDNLDTSLVINMSYMFFNCISFTEIDVSSFQTRNVTNMSGMFAGNAGKVMNLTNLDLSNFDTRNVTTMFLMFQNCRNLISLNIDNFDTRNVTDMSYLFYNCISLTTIDVSSFDTSSVTTMRAMFSSSVSVGEMSFTNLDVSSFDTKNVTNMRTMFQNCANLTNLDLSNFDTSSVTDMYGMFVNCIRLVTIDVSSFDTSNVTNMSGLFYNCTSLLSLNLSNFDTRNVTTMYFMFGCDSSAGVMSLTNLDLSSFDTSSVTDISYMFYNCANLTTELTIRNTGTTTYTDVFTGAATNTGATITFHYTNDTSSLVDSILATKNEESNIVKGILVV